MTVENKQYSANDLEHVKFTADSNNENSIVQFKQYEYPVIPDQDVGYFVEYLRNPIDQSRDQNVDGSVTPVTFEWSPNPIFGQVLVTGFKLILIANNISNFFDFGNRTALTNGFLIETERTDLGLTFTYANIQSNIDFNQVSDSAGQSSFSQQGNTTQDGQSLTLQFENPIKATDTFFFRSTVRDDLTPISYFRISVFFTTT